MSTSQGCGPCFSAVQALKRWTLLVLPAPMAGSSRRWPSLSRARLMLSGAWWSQLRATSCFESHGRSQASQARRVRSLWTTKTCPPAIGDQANGHAVRGLGPPRSTPTTGLFAAHSMVYERSPSISVRNAAGA